MNIAPGPDGSWDQGAYEMLRGVGDWMNVNSEAIYGTRPIAPFKEGKTCLTQNEKAIYIIYLADEDETTPPAKIWSSRIVPEDGATVTMLGTNEILRWEKVGNGFVAEIPESVRSRPPCESAWVIRISK